MTKISGVIPLRNAVKLGYPFELAIESLRLLCDELVVLVDPASEDDTAARVRALAPDRIVDSLWDMGNHDGHNNCEISVQTAKAIAAASGDWIFSLQADEALHEGEIDQIRYEIADAERHGVSALEMMRLYFYGSLAAIRQDWTIWMVRCFKRGLWKPDRDGAMRFDPIGDRRRAPSAARIYHYSRIGDPAAVAARIRNLDGFFHPPERIAAGEIPPYDFSALRKLDSYVAGHDNAEDPAARLCPFPMAGHPAGARRRFHG